MISNINLKLGALATIAGTVPAGAASHDTAQSLLVRPFGETNDGVENGHRGLTRSPSGIHGSVYRPRSSISSLIRPRDALVGVETHASIG